ncbi:MAG: tetratricopeptide repeat protein [Candidatus Omnitrophica bacterium]|nr:tetratricopeptide repeat protein [Candidatus Omnitrophota bacterium]
MKSVKKFFTIIIILVLAGASPACSAAEEAKEAELLFMSKKAYEDGFYEVSLGMLERFQKEFPGSAKAAEAGLLRAECYFYQARYPEALNILEGLLNDPGSRGFRDAVYFWIAEVHLKGNNYEKAAGFYESVIKEFPRSFYAPAAYYSLGWSLSLMERYDRAIKAFESLQEKFPNEPQGKDAAFKVIECLYNLKQYSELKKKVKPCFKLYANDSQRLAYLYFYLAESDFYLEDLEEARGNYLKSVKTANDDKLGALAHLGLAWSDLKLKRYGEAEEAFKNIKQSDLDKKSVDIMLLGQALLMFQTNRVYESKKIYDQLINAGSDPLISAQAYLGKGDALYNLAEYAAAAKVYKEGLDKIDKKNVPAELVNKLRYNLGLAYIKQGELGPAKEEIEKSTENSGDQEVRVEALSRIGDAYQDTGELTRAIEIYSKILKDHPDSSHGDYIQYQLAAARLKNEDYDAAIRSFKLMAKDYSQSGLLDDALYSLGLAYFKKGDYLSGVEAFTRFQKEFRDSELAGQALYMLGLSFLNLGKISEALSVFGDILRLNLEDTDLLQKAEYGIADCYYKLGREKEALERFKILRSRYPDSKLTSQVLWWLGQYYYQHDDPKLAARYFSSLAGDFPESALAGDAFYALGLIFSDEGDLNSASDNFKMALTLGNGLLRSRALAELGDVYYREGKFEDAKSAYSKSLEETGAKESAGIHFGLAEALEGCSESDEAIGEYLKAASLYTENGALFSHALLRAAKLYEDKEDFNEALKLYKRISRKDIPESGFARERIDWINANVKENKK